MHEHILKPRVLGIKREIDWSQPSEDVLARGTLDENFYVDLVERDPQPGSRLEKLGPFMSVQLNALVRPRDQAARINFFAGTVTDANALAETLLMRVDTATVYPLAK